MKAVGFIFSILYFIVLHGFAMRIIIFDISGQRQKLLGDIIGRYKFNTRYTSSAKEAFDLLDNFHPNLITMNLTSNEEWAFLSRVKTNSDYQQIPIVAITEDEKKRKDFLERYALLDIFIEPVKLKNVRHAIQRWTLYSGLYLTPNGDD
jgi:two-component SAPR family response regulator